jgi:small subunit ribosomal protein S15
MQAMLKKTKKAAAIKKVQLHDKDNGSSPAQIAILTERIESLSKHLKKHKLDNHSRRGLIKMVADRRSHMKFLERKNKTAYAKVTKALALK